MARLEFGRHKRVAVTADDGSSDIQTQRDWNGDSHEQVGILGFDGVAATIATGAFLYSDSQHDITAESGGVDNLDTITATDALVNDICLIKAASAQTITVTSSGNIILLSGVNETLSLLIPMVLMYDGTNWQQVVPTTAGLTNKVNTFTASNTFEDIVHTGRHQYDKGIDVASTTDMTLGGDGNVFDITGTTQIDHVLNTGWQIGSKITLHFIGALQLTHNSGSEVGDEASLFLQGDANFTTSAGDILEFVLLESIQWQETSRNKDVDTGDILPVDDSTSISKGSADPTKEVRFEVDGNSTGIVGTLSTQFSTAKTITFPDVTDTVAVKGANTFTADQDIGGFDVDNVQNLIHDLSTATTALDFTNDELQQISISANTTFTGTGYAIGKSKTLIITTDSTLRTLAFPSGWIFLGTKPADQAASKKGVLTLTCQTAIESGVIATYGVEL